MDGAARGARTERVGCAALRGVQVKQRRRGLAGWRRCSACGAHAAVRGQQVRRDRLQIVPAGRHERTCARSAPPSAGSPRRSGLCEACMTRVLMPHLKNQMRIHDNIFANYHE